MNKLMLVFVVLLMPLSSAIVCQDRTFLSEIPCEVITPVINCSTNVTITDLSNSSSFNTTISSVGDGTYNFTFNQAIGSYSLVLCDNSTGSIIVIADPTTNTIAGAGFSMPDTQVIKNELSNGIIKVTKTTKITFWIAIIAGLLALMTYLDYRKKKIRRIAEDVFKERQVIRR